MKPILFSTPMVQAILDGKKTQTRRVVKLIDFRVTDSKGYDYCFRDRRGCWNDVSEEELFQWKSPYQIGDTLWVRETWRRYDKSEECICYEAPFNCPPSGTYLYKASIDDDESRWKPSIHMPKEACRLFLEVTKVGIEQVQAITIADAQAEGMDSGAPIYDFAGLWDKLNKKRGFGWDKNPWVWVIKFKIDNKRTTCN